MPSYIVFLSTCILVSSWSHQPLEHIIDALPKNYTYTKPNQEKQLYYEKLADQISQIYSAHLLRRMGVARSSIYFANFNVQDVRGLTRGAYYYIIDSPPIIVVNIAQNEETIKLFLHNSIYNLFNKYIDPHWAQFNKASVYEKMFNHSEIYNRSLIAVAHDIQNELTSFDENFIKIFRIQYEGCLQEQPDVLCNELYERILVSNYFVIFMDVAAYTNPLARLALRGKQACLNLYRQLRFL
jgi:hypothetical protein